MLFYCFKFFWTRRWKIMITNMMVWCVLSHVWLFAILWTVAHQASLCMGYFRQEYWSGLSFPPPGDLPNPGIEPVSSASPTLQVASLIEKTNVDIGSELWRMPTTVKKKKMKSGNKWRRQASKRVGNDSANTIGQICKAAYAPFHERAVVYGTSAFLYASARWLNKTIYEMAKHPRLSVLRNKTQMINFQESEILVYGR